MLSMRSTLLLLVAFVATPIPVLSVLPPWSPSLQQGTIGDLVTYYFNSGHQYNKILHFLGLYMDCLYP